MAESICEAIRLKLVIEFRYDGHQRLVEPYYHGWTRRDNEALRGYQVSGGSTTGEVPGWRLFRFDRIERLRLTDTTFAGDRSDYNPDDRDLRVHCRV